ncbi:MAG: molybdopterin-binding protein [Candidatus Eisenbacteria bacterium]
MKYGARNQLIGVVRDVRKGQLMCQVDMEVEPGTMSSVMTVDSLTELGVKKGDRVRIVVKAVNVLLVRE